MVSCTNLAGVSKWNTQASIPLQGPATVSGASTHTWTTQVGDKISAWAKHKIAKVTFVDVLGLGTLSLDGIDSVSHAYHDGTGPDSTYRMLHAGQLADTMSLSSPPSIHQAWSSGGSGDGSPFWFTSVRQPLAIVHGGSP